MPKTIEIFYGRRNIIKQIFFVGCVLFPVFFCDETNLKPCCGIFDKKLILFACGFRIGWETNSILAKDYYNNYGVFK